MKPKVRELKGESGGDDTMECDEITSEGTRNSMSFM